MSPALGVAQEVPAPPPASDIRVYDVDGLRFEYLKGQVVQVRRGTQSTMVSVQFVDEVSGQTSSDSFLAITRWERAPVMAGASSPDEAVALATLSRLNDALDRSVHSEEIGLSLEAMEVVRSYYIDFGVGNTTAVFAVVRDGEGWATVYLQHGQQTEATVYASEFVISSIRLGERHGE